MTCSFSFVSSEVSCVILSISSYDPFDEFGPCQTIIHDSKLILVSVFFGQEWTIIFILTNWAKLKVLIDNTIFLQNCCVMYFISWLVNRSYYYPIAPSLEDLPIAQL